MELKKTENIRPGTQATSIGTDKEVSAREQKNLFQWATQKLFFLPGVPVLRDLSVRLSGRMHPGTRSGTVSISDLLRVPTVGVV